ncbi:hypothetical protein G6F61_014969 [Rhizopus arrhizus]|nr:hypothetical protein G6F61_014969 [Rhizopus arrhizus]
MAVPPRYDSVQDYAEIGLAVATLDGRQQLIDRQGEPVGEPLDAGIQDLFLADGVPARAAVHPASPSRKPTARGCTSRSTTNAVTAWWTAIGTG